MHRSSETIGAIVAALARQGELSNAEKRRRDFKTVRRMIIDDVRPKTNIEWLWISDLTEISWEIIRCLKQK